MTLYKLNENRQTVKCDVFESSEYMVKNGRRVAFDRIGRAEVSTVFLGVDHSYNGHIPLLFETMVFGLADEIQERWTTWDEAENGHKAILEKVSAAVLAERVIDGTGRIQAERQRQIIDEGFSLLQDEKYVERELILAAQSYLMAAEFVEQFPSKDPAKMTEPSWWPWQKHCWRPSADPIRNLEKAGALIAAEIDRLQRAAMRSETNSKGGDKCAR